jgi:pimeloyl-ACP methyl ester carboxylesterase
MSIFGDNMYQAAILIHGTFAHNALWTQPESPLCISLRKCTTTPLKIEKFLWSGENSFSHRREASIALTNRILEISNDPENTGVHLIAHSHGGNIALHASINASEYGAKIKSLTTLGTPFLHVNRKQWASPLSLSLISVCWILLLYFVCANYFPATIVNIFYILPIVATLLVGLLLVFRRLESDAENSIKNNGLSSDRPNNTPTLCIRYRLDEAGLWLTLLSLFNFAERFSNKIRQILTGNGSFLILMRNLLFATILSVILSEITNGHLKFASTSLIFGGAILIAMSLPALSFLGSLIKSHKLGFAGSPKLYSIYLDLDLSVKPKGVIVRMERMSFLLGFMRTKKTGTTGFPTPHSLPYLDPKSISTVTDFVNFNV